MGKLAGQTAIVTGSDSGIGQATAIEFAREGADVVINYLEDRNGADSTKRQVEALGAKACVVQADVGREDEVRRLFETGREQFGTPTLLVNNAGVDASGVHVADMPLETWTKALNTNLTGPFLCCREFIKGLRDERKPGKIINIGSVHEEIPRAGASGYDAAKGGLRNLTRTLALELAPLKINVNTIAPGMVLTPFNQEAINDPKAREEQTKSIPLKRAAEPKEVALLAVYLASHDADYVTGSSFVIDGGLMQNQGQGA